MSGPQTNIPGTLGATFLGLVVSSMLYGVACVQTFLYSREAANDRFLLKAVVGLLWFLNSLQLGFCIYGQYFQMVTNFGNPRAAQMRSWSLVALTVISGITDLVVRTFFARRVLILSRSLRTFRLLGKAMAILIVTISILASSMMNVYAIRIYIIRSAPVFTPKLLSEILGLGWVLYVFNGASAVADVLIAASLCTLLAKNKTGFKNTDTLVSSVMALTIQTGLLTSLVALAILFSFTAQPEAFIALGIRYILVQLHINSLMVSLNARESFRNRYATGSSGLSAGVRSDAVTFPHAGQVSIPLEEAGKITMSKEVATYSDSSKHAEL